MTTAAPTAHRAATFLVGSASLVISMVVGLTWGVILLVLIAVSTALVPALGIGLLMFAGLASLMLGVERTERARARAVYRLPIPEPAPARHRPNASVLARAFAPFGTATFWRGLLHHGLKMLLGIVGVAAVAYLLALGIGGLATLASGAPFFRVFTGITLTAPWGAVTGAALILVALALLAALVAIDRQLDVALLFPTAETLRREVATLSDANLAAERAAEGERRRIERDLHDGAQPRLVALAMTLGMAKSKLDSDPEAAKTLLDEAHGEAKAAVVDLRQLARGIHPAVLTDRGLDAALSALAARSPVPVRVRVDLPARPSPAAESVAYFVVSEALTNVAKHSGASRADVVVTADGPTMRITVIDDGRGGATVVPGADHTGLAGLRDRVVASRGRFDLVSPTGGPTVLTAEIPCA